MYFWYFLVDLFLNVQFNIVLNQEIMQATNHLIEMKKNDVEKNLN